MRVGDILSYARICHASLPPRRMRMNALVLVVSTYPCRLACCSGCGSQPGRPSTGVRRWSNTVNWSTTSKTLSSIRGPTTTMTTRRFRRPSTTTLEYVFYVTNNHSRSFSRYLQTNLLSLSSHSTSPRYLRYH